MSARPSTPNLISLPVAMCLADLKARGALRTSRNIFTRAEMRERKLVFAEKRVCGNGSCECADVAAVYFSPVVFHSDVRGKRIWKLPEQTLEVTPGRTGTVTCGDQNGIKD